MRKHIRLYAVWAVAVMMVTTGCLQPASDADFQAPQGLDRSTETPRPTLTDTPGPSPTPMVFTTEVLIEVTTIVEVTSTPEPTETFSALSASDLTTPTDIPTLGLETATPTNIAELVLETETPTSDGLAVAQVQPEDLGIVESEIQEQQEIPTNTLDPLYATATQYVLETTLTPLAQTLTAEGPQQVQPSFTPTFDPGVQPVFTSRGAPSPTTAFVPGGNCVHEVVAGENLFRLSLRYGVRVADIAAASNVQNIQLIYIGQRLTIPGCGTTGITPPPTSFPTATFSSGGVSVPQSGGGTGSVGGTTYLVQQGDTLFEISLRYGVPVNSIVAANPSITDPNFIVMNTEIVIPAQ